MKIGSALLLIAMIVGIIYFLTSSEQVAWDDNQHQTDNEIAALTEENQIYKTKLQILEQANQQLRLELARIQKPSRQSDATEKTHVLPVHGSSNNLNPKNLEEATTDTRPSKPTMKQILAANEAMQEIPKYLATFSGAPADINADLKKKFEAESADPEWAENYEVKLHQLFSVNDTLSKYNPESISCKSTRCQIKIPISDYDESNEVVSALSKMLEMNQLGLENALVFTVPDLSKGYVDYYVGRDSSVKLYQ